MHKNCFTAHGWKILDDLAPALAKFDAVLAGGTALALQIGHRISVDLDFFTNTKFDVDDVLAAVKKAGYGYEVIAQGENHVVAIIEGVKFSIFYYEYPFIETSVHYGVTIAGILDIAAMKVIAISQRGSKRDFVDLYRILQDTPFTKVAIRMVERYGVERVSPTVIGKAIIYFNDADPDLDPQFIGKKVVWETVKKYFVGHVRQFMIDIDLALKYRL